MREILFRGKNLDTGEWVEGNYIHQTLYYGDEVDWHWIMVVGEFDCDYYDAYRIDPKTLCQYTGFEDKNGKKIFEGDIVDASCAHGIERAVMGFCYGHYQAFSQYYGYLYTRPNECEIIGNIHDNPELLNEGESSND